jgi:hypothetical protein
VFAVTNQSIPTFQLFKSVSIHNQYFKIYPGLIAFQKGGIHSNQHKKILTISHRQVHHANDIENEKKNNQLEQHLPFKIQMVTKCNVLSPWGIEIFRVLHHATDTGN